jgi:hypothetical protein
MPSRLMLGCATQRSPNARSGGVPPFEGAWGPAAELAPAEPRPAHPTVTHPSSPATTRETVLGATRRMPRT